ncbi:unnamed protein product [Mycena citricolor]|uniref:Calpain catalytic domain-containing protein n=1 Tax=Mycena citricolor TaxID=2018698 RepID=A0AAD2HY62_9AGAR|nr:unnamed protein product [Mycena citricolor]
MSSAEDAQSIHAKAVKTEFAQDYDAAFRLYIKAAESFLHLSRAAAREEDKVKWKGSAKKALERAERIKAVIEHRKTGGTSSSDARLTPVGVDYFSQEEQFYALKKGGVVNGRVFPAWDEPVAPDSGNVSVLGGDVELSAEQLKVSPIWQKKGPLNENIVLRPQDILQQIITDCSLSASLSVCLEYASRSGIPFRPCDAGGETFRCPLHKVAECDDRYDLRVLFNGAWRRIRIDDRLPCDPATGALVCMATSGNTVAFPSFVEKAYMKLMGGYDFPGSNSSIDLHALLGWIPEHIAIKSSNFERETTWQRLLNGFASNQCMVTLGTGNESHIRWRGVSLLNAHSYAVIAVSEDENGRRLTILDSWTGEASQAASSLEMSWTDSLDVFDSIYLSWDPHTWPNTASLHGTWRKQPSAGVSHVTRTHRLAFESVPDEREVWVLLTRHVADSRSTTDFVSLRVHREESAAEYCALAMKSKYSNSPHVLTRTSIPAHTAGNLLVVACYDGDAAQIGFTLAVYGADISWDRQVLPPPISIKVNGVFTSKNAGGNSSHPTFMNNPQYHLRIHAPKNPALGRKTELVLTSQTRREVPSNIAVVWSQGERCSELAQNDVVASSGSYGYGSTRLAATLQAGDYTVILSTFEPGQLGSFSLEAESSTLKFDLKPIAHEGAGMYSKQVRGEWTAETAMGGPTFKQYMQNPRLELKTEVPNDIMIRIQLVQRPQVTPVNVTVFPASLSLGQHVMTSGPYSDSLAGAITPKVRLAAGQYWILPSTYSPGVVGSFHILIYSSSPVEVIDRSAGIR